MPEITEPILSPASVLPDVKSSSDSSKSEGSSLGTFSDNSETIHPLKLDISAKGSSFTTPNGLVNDDSTVRSCKHCSYSFRAIKNKIEEYCTKGILFQHKY